MKLACFIILAGLVTAGAGVEGAAPGIQVITASEIRTAGLTRLGDILLLADAWTVGTLDGFDWRASPNGLSTSREQEWRVMVDGQVMDIDLFDSTNLNLLPIPLAAVDSVEVVSLPLLYGGVLTDRGLIHIHTRRPVPGPSFLGDFMTGSETGDPGPYAYTGLATPNIDATGPDAAIAIGYHRSDAYIQATVSTAVHFFRDPAMLERNSAILGSPTNITPSGDFAPIIAPPRQPVSHSVLGRMGFDDVNPGMRKLSASLRAGLEGLGGRHEPFAGYTETERYFLFVNHLGREIPVNSRFAHLGLSGDFTFSSEAAISYRLSHSSHRLLKYPNALDVDLDWDSRVLSSNVEGRRGGSDLSITGGIGWERHAPRTRYAQMEKEVNIVRLYTRLLYTLTRRIHQVVGLSAVNSENRTAVQAFFSTDWHLHPDHALQAHLTFSERLPEEDLGLRYWVQQGFVVPADLGAVYVTYYQPVKSSQCTADLTWRAAAGPGVQISSTASVRFFDDLYIETQVFMFDSTDCSFSSPVFGRPGQSGTIARVHLTAKHRIFAGLSHRLSYSHQTAAGGDPVFKQIWNTVPEHRASYRVTYESPRNVDLWGMLTYLSSSTWIDYALIDGETCESPGCRTVYRSKVDGFLMLDLQVQKWLWQRRLRGELLCRNVWNEEVRYHPVGARFDLSFYVGLSLELGPR